MLGEEMKRRVLRGDHNQCPTCAEYFNSTHAFDMHRIGAFGVDRRCMTVAEMLEVGMCKSKTDWWITHKYEPDADSDPTPDDRMRPDALGRGYGST